jgi:hypothetical protein
MRDFMSVDSVTVLVTLETFQGATDLELPADVAVQDLLPLVVAICAPSALASMPGGDQPATSARWALGRPGGAPFSAERTLVDYEIMDGAILLLREEASWGRVSMGALPLGGDDAETPASEVTLGGIGIRWNRNGLLS